MHPPTRAAWLGQYGLSGDEPPGRPAARILRWCAELDAALRGLDAQADAEALMAEVLRVDIRRYLFMLEGLLRLYRRRIGQRAEQALKRVKVAEDTIGAVDNETTMLNAAVRLDAPAPVREYLAARVTKVSTHLVKRMRRRWLPDRHGLVKSIKRLVRFVAKTDWDPVETDRRYLCGEMARELLDIGQSDLDMDELEDGLHELRRDMRWFPIYLTALDGFAMLDDGLNPIPEYAPLLQDPAAGSPYARLASSPEEPVPVRLSRSLYIADTVHIAELGELKDRGLLIEGLSHALRAAGVERKRKRATACALELLGMTPDDVGAIHARADAIYREVKRLRLYDHLAEPLLAVAEA